MVLALAALAAAAASFPTGFGFGAGYGAGVRIGYDVIYPKLAPFAAKITDDIIAAVSQLFGSNADIPAGSSAGSGFDFATDNTKIVPGADRRAPPTPSIDTGVQNKKQVSIRQTQMYGTYIQSNFTGEMSIDELRSLVNQYEKRRDSVGVKSTAGRRITQSINSIYAAIASF